MGLPRRKISRLSRGVTSRNIQLCYTDSVKLYKNTKLIHLPINLGGVIIDILALLFVATVVMAANRNSHSVSDMLYMIFPFAVTTFLFREWLAARLS